MYPRPYLVCLAAVPAILGLGCGPSQRPYMDDPLVASKTSPIDRGQASGVAPTPSGPVRTAAASAKTSERSAVQLASYKPAAGTRPEPAPARGTGEARSVGNEEYGCAPDFSWLQGEMIRLNPRECWLRYGGPNADDVDHTMSLIDTSLLDPFHTGDVIWVTGQRVPPPRIGRSKAKSPMLYEVREVHLIRAVR